MAERSWSAGGCGRAGLQSYLARLPGGCVVAMEACGGAHHWARLARRLGHRAVLMSPQFVAPYVKSNKNDANDADGIAEASARPTMRFVPAKSAEQEHVQQLHRARQMAVRNRTAQGNQIHGFLLEYGIEAPRAAGAACCSGWRRRWRMRRTSCRSRAGRCCGNWGEELGRLEERVGDVRRAAGGRGAAVAGVPAADGDPRDRRADGRRRWWRRPATRRSSATAARWRRGSAWCRGSTRPGGGRCCSGSASGATGYLRALLIPRRARSALHRAGRRSDRRSRWAVAVETRRGANVAAVALANKNARVAWALLRHGESYDAAHRQSASPDAGAEGAGRRRGGRPHERTRREPRRRSRVKPLRGFSAALRPFG